MYTIGDMKHPIQRLSINSQTFRYIDTGENTNSVPLIIVAGWNQTIEVWKDAIEELEKLGKRVVMIEAPHGITGNTTTYDEPINSIPLIMIQKAQAHIALLEHLKITRVDVIAQSQGGIDALVATLLKPKVFHNIIIFNPAGMVGADQLPFLLGRFTLEAMRDILTHAKQLPGDMRNKINQRIAFQALKHPFKSTRSAHAITKIRLEQLIELIRVKCQSQIVCIAGEDDTLFPIDKMRTQASLKSLGGFLTVKGNHVAIFRHPAIYMNLAYHMLAAMRQLEVINK